MKLRGIVTNVTAFGAFVDIGVHQDGLVHISQMADRFVKDPHEIVKVHQQVMVTVINIDLERNRISLSMRGDMDKSEGKFIVEGKQPDAGNKKNRPKRPKREPFNNPFQKIVDGK